MLTFLKDLLLGWWRNVAVATALKALGGATVAYLVAKFTGIMP